MDESDDMAPSCVQPHGSYSRLLSRRPWITVLIVFLLSTVSLVALLVKAGPPNFGQSEKYFMTMGTEISARKQQLDALLDSSTVARARVRQYSSWSETAAQSLTQLRSKRNNRRHRSRSLKLPRKSRAKGERRPIAFCRDLGGAAKGMIRFVFRARASEISSTSSQDRKIESLLSLNIVLEMCTQEKKLRRMRAFQKNCQRVKRNCCRNWSLPNLVAFFGKRPTCFEVTEGDVQLVKGLLTRCASLYDRGELNADCWRDMELQQTCSHLPLQCQDYEVFLLLHYILTVGTDRGHEALTVLPIEGGPAELTDKVTLFRALERMNSKLVQVVAAAFNIDAAMVPIALLQDLRWMMAALMAVLILVLLYTSSFILTLITMITITLSLTLGYAVYRLVVTVPDFPAPNLMAVMVAVAAGADDVFVLVSAWRRAKRDALDGRLEKLVSDMLRHAGLSVTVTSLSTAAAFLANLASTVAAVRCFAVYAASVVLLNLLLCLTLVPAAIVICDKHCRSNLSVGRTVASWRKRLIQILQSCLRNCFSRTVIRARYLWVFLLFLLMGLSLVAVFHWPGFRLSTTSPSSSASSRPSPTFYSASHPFERYRQIYSQRLGFELSITRNTNYTLRFVWGVLPSDSRHPLVPWSVSPLHPDPVFDMTTSAAQLWLSSFCDALDAADFVRNFRGGISDSDCPLHPGRMYSSFTAFALNPVRCNRTGCCQAARLPLNSRYFARCLHEFEQYRFQHNLLVSYSGTRYKHRSAVNQSSDEVFTPMGLVVSVHSSGNMLAPFKTRDLFWQDVQMWFKRRLRSAPPELRGGFVISDLVQWDVERALASGLPWTLGLAVAAAAVTILITTLNPLLAALAFLCLGTVVSSTVAFLIVATGWSAGLTESVIATAAIGLAVDFIMHYGVAFRLASAESRVERAQTAVIQMASPVSAAALTTLCAGVFVLPAQLTVYTQVGFFLTTVATSAWIVASVGFPALLACCGPSSTCCQFACVSCSCEVCGPANHRRVDKTVYTPQVSEFRETASPVDSDYLPHNNVNHSTNHVYHYHQLLGDGCSSTGMDLELDVTRETDDYDFVEEEETEQQQLSNMSPTPAAHGIKRANSTSL